MTLSAAKELSHLSRDGFQFSWRYFESDLTCPTITIRIRVKGGRDYNVPNAVMFAFQLKLAFER